MKILHSLVGYLAVTTLPFHPFAFPLASIDYDSDGYVNLNTLQNHIDGALVKHVLGSIEETCKTVTTQNHSDTASGDIILVEARQDIPAGGNLFPAVLIISGILAAVIISLDWISYDDPVRLQCRAPCTALCFKFFCQKREAFTRNSIFNNYSKYPKFNWVICHSSYSVDFYGVEGTDWGHTHYELPISWGRTIGSVLLTHLQ